MLSQQKCDPLSGYTDHKLSSLVYTVLNHITMEEPILSYFTDDLTGRGTVTWNLTNSTSIQAPKIHTYTHQANLSKCVNGKKGIEKERKKYFF